MIVEPIIIKFTYSGVFYSLTVPANDNLSYNLAEVFKELIEKASANPEIVIEELKNNFPNR